MVSRLEKKLGDSGVDLHDLAALAAAVEDVVQQEVLKRLDRVYKVHGFQKDGTISDAEAAMAIKTYFIDFISVGFMNATTIAPWRGLEKAFEASFRNWDAAHAWLQKTVRPHVGDQSWVNHSSMANAASAIGRHYSVHNDKECRELKKTLLDLRVGRGMPGRVKLSKFYERGLDVVQWNFDEKPEYLRAMGALDETNSSMPMVIIPNYVASRSNCLEATELYTVCCRNECEEMLASLEQDIAQPWGSPERILELVSAMSSDTILGPRKLGRGVQMRLHTISSQGGGKVRLHGRLFSQWMHHAFPNECPYPHEAGTTSPLTPNEWMGAEVSLSKAERQRIVDEDSCAAQEPDADSLPWSDEEQLLASNAQSSSAAESSSSSTGREDRKRSKTLGRLLGSLLLLSACASLSDLAKPLQKRMVLTLGPKSPQLLFLCLLSAAAWSASVLQSGLFLVTIVFATLAIGFTGKQSSVHKKISCEKSLV